MLTHSPTKDLKTEELVENISHLKLTETRATRFVEKTSRVNGGTGTQVNRLQTPTPPDGITAASENMTSFTELSDVTSPDLRRTYQTLLSRDVGTMEYLSLFTSAPSWPMRDLETSAGESVISSDTEEYVDVVNA